MSIRHVALCICVLLLAPIHAACDATEPEPDSARPLRPLVYTEHPELTPEGAAVRERRLMRNLLEGSENAGEWGPLGDRDPAGRGRATTPEALGRALFEALVSRNERQFDAIFVTPEQYTELVHVDIEEARTFVDEVQGESMEAWRTFEPEPASEARPGGFRAAFRYVNTRPGQPRGVDGHPTDADAAVQFWNNEIDLVLRDTDVGFTLRVPKIVRVGDSYRVASPIEIDERLDVLLRTGLHLKPELLRSREYPFPLSVGNFWRYRRGRELAGGESADPLERGLVEASHATEVLVEVVSVDRYPAWRLVRLRRSYNDAALTKSRLSWLVTPRTIYACTDACSRVIEQLDELLDYLANGVPVYRFPLRPGRSWGVGGGPLKKDAAFRVEPISSIEVPAGTWESVVVISGRGPLGRQDSRLAVDQERVFAFGKGVLRRTLRLESGPMHEELVEFRVLTP